MTAHLPSRDRGLHGAGRRSDRHRHRRQQDAQRAARVPSQRHFVRGTCGMARTSDPNSANSQFFIMFAPAPIWTANTRSGARWCRAWNTSTRSSAAPARTGRVVRRARPYRPHACGGRRESYPHAKENHHERLERLDPENTLYLDLKEGRVIDRALPELAPKHVERIKTLVRAASMTARVFHRVIEGFMAQGGDPTGTGTGGSDLEEYPRRVPASAQFLRGTVRHGALRRSEQRQQPVLHHVRAGAASERPVHRSGARWCREWNSWTRSSAAAAAAARCPTRTRS